MVWDRRMRKAGWAVFFLMWVPFAVMIFAAATDDDMDFVRPLAIFFLLFLLVFVLLFGSFPVGRYEERRIRMTGIPAEAVVLGVTATGTSYNDQPMVVVALEVHPQYDAVFPATVECLSPYPGWEDLLPGRKIRVVYTEGTRDVIIDEL